MNIRTFVAILSRKAQYDFPKMRGGQRPFGTFQKIHQFWRRHPSLIAKGLFVYSELLLLEVHFIQEDGDVNAKMCRRCSPWQEASNHAGCCRGHCHLNLLLNWSSFCSISRRVLPVKEETENINVTRSLYYINIFPFMIMCSRASLTVRFFS